MVRVSMNKELLIIFTRNPELGKCKTRLAAEVGDKIALDVYNFLLDHTRYITKKINAVKFLYYSDIVPAYDRWNGSIYHKKQQKGKDLGEKMLNAFKDGFSEGFDKIVIIGSDIFDLGSDDIEMAFQKLDSNDFVLGPAQDGGYYLLGMTRLKEELFYNKSWGTNSVLKDTMRDLENESIFLLAVRNDVDIYDDIKDEVAFQPFLNDLPK